MTRTAIQFRAIELAIVPRAPRVPTEELLSLLEMSPMQHTFRSKRSGSARLDMIMADHIGDMIENTLRDARRA